MLRPTRYVVGGVVQYHTGFVYVIAMDGGFHKIGLSDQPRKRMCELQTAHPLDLKLIHTSETRRPLDVEREAHRILKAHRLRGEWFRVSADEAIAAVERACLRYPEPRPTGRRRKGFEELEAAYAAAVNGVT